MPESFTRRQLTLTISAVGLASAAELASAFHYAHQAANSSGPVKFEHLDSDPAREIEAIDFAEAGANPFEAPSSGRRLHALEHPSATRSSGPPA